MKKSGDENRTEANERLARLRASSGSYVQEDIWLDYLEGNGSASFKEDLDVLLDNSPADRQVLAELGRVRRAVKRSDDVALPENGRYYDEFHDRIMAAIDEDSRSSSPAPLERSTKSTRVVKLAWPTLIGSLTMLMLLVAVGWHAMRAPLAEPSAVATAAVGQRPSEDREVDRKLASVSMSESLIGFENDADFVADAAIEHLKGLDGRQADEIFARLESN